jgi:iron(III) transport system permease protein
MPTYVLAYVYAHLLGIGDPAEQWWQAFMGPEARILSPQSFAGVTLIMALDTFPFVYLLARGALLNLNVSFKEVARACGGSPWTTLWRVTLPLIRPAIAAGLALVILYVISDFGAVSLLRYQTLTYAVYQQMTGRYDHTAASILSVLLIAMAIIFLVTERWFRQRSRFHQTSGRYHTSIRHREGLVGTALITTYVMLVFGAAFGIPAIMLIQWSVTAIFQGALDVRFFGFIWNSSFLSALVAGAAVLIGLPLAYLASRRLRGSMWPVCKPPMPVTRYLVRLPSSPSWCSSPPSRLPYTVLWWCCSSRTSCISFRWDCNPWSRHCNRSPRMWKKWREPCAARPGKPSGA